MTIEQHNDKTSGLQFEGKPTERALRMSNAKLRLTGCILPNGQIHEGLSAHFVHDFMNDIYNAFDLMAKEKTND